MSFEQRFTSQSDQSYQIATPGQSSSPAPRPMTASSGSTANGYHYNVPSRRSSLSTAPYTIPVKSSTNMPPGSQRLSSSFSGTTGPYSISPGNLGSSPHTGGPIHSHLHQQQPQQSHLGTSVPMLSREFVVRRISEGETGRLKEELKCEACGKGYKHISSLAKHLWEHTPEWNMTKKLLISKHQQVQLLEAASILCSMTENGSESGGFRSRSQSLSTPSPVYAQVSSYSQSNQRPQQSQYAPHTKLPANSPHLQSLSSVNNVSNFREHHAEETNGPRQIENDAPISPSPDVQIENNSSKSPLSIEEHGEGTPTSLTLNTTNSNLYLHSNLSQSLSGTTSKTPPVYTTTLRKNSVSQYPPSSLSISVSSTPRKTMLCEKPTRSDDVVAQYGKDGLMAPKTEESTSFSGESENEDEDNHYGTEFVPRDNREEDEKIFGDLED
ncbi:hypothetical protein KL921_001268 [Ogataea angusta]|uniref:C2H2-type domain-containing protein n=1 Tax=Pichia angusta TaxID=870730 RepID=A0AAN6DKU8_PICAN|nr:uncharacterized protein KL928_001432 [Ogataea angusta]KAG7813722.1 hypothetical protein KL921_001268 [Ogataea angusta]KAG7821348.1 hypothetical protein KL928_001432 [Ogataea angusta]KAG7825953.1 hypothetical protein KL909_000005 [Ogataea angusta]KAG7832302.1 hypothetical protein KL920_000637 [Ogataea angusta]KAG7836475.1 hypothetical protein KL943_002124 [Ogataea angusta]